MHQIKKIPEPTQIKQSVSLLKERYINQTELVVNTETKGCGKSFLACALAYQACMQGHRTLYQNMNRYIEKVTLANELLAVQVIHHSG